MPEKDIEKIFELWENSIDKYSINLSNENNAELNYDSELAKAIIVAKNNHGSTTAEKIAKGDKNVCNAKKEMLESQRLVKAGQAKLNYLEQLYHYRKLQIRINNKISES